MAVSTASQANALPSDFVCEHTTATSRVLVLLQRPAHAPAAQTVLTHLDPRVAEQAADLLRHVAEHGSTPGLLPWVERVADTLPADQVDQWRQAVDWAAVHRWPVPEHVLRPRPAHSRGEDRHADLNEWEAERDSAPRLVELTGPVVRVVRLIEVHLPDAQAFLARMQEDGWEPMPADHLPDDDPQDLVGAVMSATDELPPLSGARLVTEASHAQLLRPDRGDELLDWSAHAVTVDFGTGWRHEEAETSD